MNESLMGNGKKQK